jgi:hypothetical protein
MASVRSSRVGLVLLAAGVCMILTACSVSSAHKTSSGTTSSTTTTTRSSAVSSSYITTRQLNKQPAGSPARAALSFWQDVQFQDYPDALALLTSTFAAKYAGDLSHFSTYVSADQPRWLVRPSVLSSDVNGSTSRVVLLYPFGGTMAPTVFDLQRVHGSWLISYNFYLVNRLTARPTSPSAPKTHSRRPSASSTSSTTSTSSST